MAPAQKIFCSWDLCGMPQSSVQSGSGVTISWQDSQNFIPLGENSNLTVSNCCISRPWVRNFSRTMILFWSSEQLKEDPEKVFCSKCNFFFTVVSKTLTLSAANYTYQYSGIVTQKYKGSLQNPANRSKSTLKIFHMVARSWLSGPDSIYLHNKPDGMVREHHWALWPPLACKTPSVLHHQKMFWTRCLSRVPLLGWGWHGVPGRVEEPREGG